MNHASLGALVTLALGASCGSNAQLAIRAEMLWTMESGAIPNGIVLIGEDGKIQAVGAGLAIPEGWEIRECAVATPGLVDVRTTVGMTGIYNEEADQDQIDSSSPVQPQLRAIDAYNPLDRLVAYVRGFGVTTVHTGHAPGELISGQTLIAKTRGGTVEEAVIVPEAGIAATLSPIAQKGGGKSPGTRAKMMEMLREELFKARAYQDKWAKWRAGEEPPESKESAEPTAHSDSEADKKNPKDPPAIDLKLEALTKVLAGELPFIVTANRAQDIANALRLADEFKFTLWLDMGAESYLFTEELKKRGTPVLLLPPMFRGVGDSENASYATAKTLADAGVTFAIQTGFEGYVPKVRVVLFEAGAAAGYGGLGFNRALRAVTIDAARILGIDDRVGSLAPGKDGDVALYDGDPFEYTTHCVGTVIEGEWFVGERDFERNYP